MKIKDMLKAFAMGFNYENIFKKRKIFDKGTPKLIKIITNSICAG